MGGDIEKVPKKKGGTRPGAGRKTKRSLHSLYVEAAEEQIRDRLPSIIDNLFKLGDGIKVMGHTKDGDPVVYEVPPNVKALMYLVDRALGKPRQSVDLTSKGEAVSSAVTIVLPDNRRNPGLKSA